MLFLYNDTIPKLRFISRLGNLRTGIPTTAGAVVDLGMNAVKGTPNNK
jgi:hypothetical protein